MKTLFEIIPKDGVHDLCGRKYSHKELLENFLGKFGQKSFAPPKICLPRLWLWTTYLGQKGWRIHYGLNQPCCWHKSINTIKDDICLCKKFGNVSQSFLNAYYNWTDSCSRRNSTETSESGTCKGSRRPRASKAGPKPQGPKFFVPSNFVVSRKICFKLIVKTSLVFCRPQTLKPWYGPDETN